MLWTRCFSLWLLGCWTLGPGSVLVNSAPWRATAVHWKRGRGIIISSNLMNCPWLIVTPFNSLFPMWPRKILKCKISTLFQNASHAHSISSKLSQCRVWFIAIDPDCVKQAAHRRKVHPLFVGDVWTRPKQQGASFHLHLNLSFSLSVPLVVPSFSHIHTNKSFVTLQSASLSLQLSLLVFLNYLSVCLSSLPFSHYPSLSLFLPSLPSFFSCCFLSSPPSSTHSSTVFFNFLCMKDSSRCFNNK